MNKQPEAIKQAPRRKVLEGIVTSTKSSKTIVVTVERRFMHAFYKKHVTFHKKFHAHDEREKAKEGDRVKIISCRPLSAKKRWSLLSIMSSLNQKQEEEKKQ